MKWCGCIAHGVLDRTLPGDPRSRQGMIRPGWSTAQARVAVQQLLATRGRIGWGGLPPLQGFSLRSAAYSSHCASSRMCRSLRYSPFLGISCTGNFGDLSPPPPAPCGYSIIWFIPFPFLPVRPHPPAQFPADTPRSGRSACPVHGAAGMRGTPPAPPFSRSTGPGPQQCGRSPCRGWIGGLWWGAYLNGLHNGDFRPNFSVPAILTWHSVFFPLRSAFMKAKCGGMGARIEKAQGIFPVGIHFLPARFFVKRGWGNLCSEPKRVRH
jgi:hypothetical protein